MRGGGGTSCTSATEIQKGNVRTFQRGRITSIMELLSLCLFVGIGVDDMFVIVQAWGNLSPIEHKTLPIPERMGLTLQHAVSFLFVSLTGDTLILIGNDHDPFNHWRPTVG